ncbi:Metalloprotease TIKI1 [Araneus ventricosus]|uniref:Metalloprotease TIKI homolog n=1 Tax=Araneus ventricosus TaxID=182803 RepID=A0A4Y2DWR3_ARAVE|nr:Metalloprotease TIKI1 [Araneus ventricosus]
MCFPFLLGRHLPSPLHVCDSSISFLENSSSIISHKSGNFSSSFQEYRNGSVDPHDGDPFSFLWTIKRNPPSYLFGTIHVPYTKVWDSIPDNAKQAFAISTQVYFELDLVDPTTVSTLSSCQLLPHGKNLSDVLPGDLYSRLKRHLEYVRGMMPHWMTKDQRGRGLYADYLFNAIAGNWERKRPVWVMLMVNSLTESDVRSRGVPVLDLYLAQEAERLRKKTAAVEKVEEQCLPLNGLNFSQVSFLKIRVPEDYNRGLFVC